MYNVAPLPSSLQKIAFVSQPLFSFFCKKGPDFFFNPLHFFPPTCFASPTLSPTFFYSQAPLGDSTMAMSSFKKLAENLFDFFFQ